MLRGNLRGSQITYLHTVLGKVYLRGGKLKEAAESFKEAQKYLVIQFYYYYYYYYYYFLFFSLSLYNLLYIYMYVHSLLFSLPLPLSVISILHTI